MKTYKICILYILCAISYAQQQSPEIKPELPNIIPPSPTVAALMKYEEIPVSNYTGVPSVNIPLFDYSFPSQKIGLNISLSYHSSSTKLDEVASDIGLGWSFTGGGSISRTVLGMPDEQIESNKIGIYRVKESNGLNYYQTLQTIQGTSFFNMMNPANIVNSSTDDSVKEFLWETNAKGMFDTQHDIWQFNFFGHTGRFYIEKQPSGALEVKLLENTTLKIINHYNLPNSSVPHHLHYKPIGFTIYDELGYKYVFNVVEESISNSLSVTTSLNDINNIDTNSQTFNSAFHLSKIYDPNNNLLLEYQYFNAGTEHIVVNNGITYAYPQYNLNIADEINNFNLNYSNFGLGQDFILSLYKPKSSSLTTSTTYQAKKIEKIKIPRVGSVDFVYQQGRQDEDYTNRENVYIFKQIIVRDSINNIIKQFNLEHEYKYALKKKLFLKGVKQVTQNDTIDIYKLYYKEPTMIYGGNYVKDHWGYLKLNDLDYGLEKEVDKDLVSSFILEKMVLPTGGCVVFNYESNTYSFQGNEQLNNFDDNYYNWNFLNSSKILTGLNSPASRLFTIDVAQKVYFQVGMNFQVNQWFFTLYKDFYDPSNPGLNMVGGVSSESTFDQNGYTYLLLQPGEYVVRFTTPDQPNSSQNEYTSSIAAFFRQIKTSDYKNLFYGGGSRISSISTYKEDVNVQDILATPTSRKNYSYDYLIENNETQYSSGVLVSKKPIFKYVTSMYRPELNASFQGQDESRFPGINYSYEMYSSNDKVNRGKTKGSEIGYRNVTVENLGNGKTEFTYTTSIEYPDIINSIEQLYLPSINLDFKRGLLKKEETLDSLNKKLTSITYDYIFEENYVLTGLNIFGNYDSGYNSCPAFRLISDYYSYNVLKLQSCNQVALHCHVDTPVITFSPNLHLAYSSFVEAFGWAKLTSKITKEYFYPQGSNVPKIVEKTENFTYNPINKQIASHTVDNSNGEILTTNYFYHTGNSPYTQNRISEIEAIEKKKGSEVLSETRIIYGNYWTDNQSYLPKRIEASKGSQSLETQVAFENYDEFGNPLEVRKEGGTFISYIWGYNKTKPIAKIENIKYSQIDSNLILAVQNASNSSFDGTEPALISVLNDLRVALPGAMVTTYTYKPLVGVRTITNPKGDIVTYDYDDFGRLIRVYDSQGNPVSENEYHYRTQN